MFPRFAFGLGYLILLLAVGLVALGVHFMSGTVPQYSGSAKVAGISGTVDIDRDDYAIPHIHAATERDAYFGLGYAEAQDRLFQMELERRLGAGRMSELFGAKTLPLDKWSRTIGFARIADQMWLKAGPHTREVVTAFVAGINAYLADHRTHLDFTFDALRLVPEQWRPQDCMMIGRLMSWEMNFSALADAAFGDFAMTLDTARLRSLFPIYPDNGATVLGGANPETFVSNYMAGTKVPPMKTVPHPELPSLSFLSPPPPPPTKPIAVIPHDSVPGPAAPRNTIPTAPASIPHAPPSTSTAPKAHSSQATTKKPVAKPKPQTKTHTKPQTKPNAQPATPQPPPFKPGVKPPKQPHLPKPLPSIGARISEHEAFASMFRLMTGFDSVLGAQMGGGSNSFVVSGSHSADGKPILENDTHLQLESPSRWYLAHLTSDDGMNVAGFLIPGMPVILSGRTKELSWGITNGMADECDYFIEKLDSTGTKYILPNGKAQNFILIKDTIRVRDSQSVSEASDEMNYQPGEAHAMQKVPITVRMTVHGPVMTPMHPDMIAKVYRSDTRAGGVPDTSMFLDPSRPVTMMWNGTYALADELAGFLELPHARSVHEACAAMKDFATPCLNLCLADQSGNIGYQFIGRMPRRSGNDARQLLPRDGTNPADQWTGFVSTPMLPTATNPPRGYFVSANNPPMDDRSSSTNNSTIPLGLNWEPSSRADRIGELLSERSRIDVAYMQSVQTDIISSYDVRRVLPYLLALYPDPNPPEITPDSSAAIRLDSMALYWKEDSLLHHTTISDSAMALVRQKDSAQLASHRVKRELDTSVHYVNVDAFTSQVLSYLRNWDGGMRSEEIAPTIYSVFLNRLLFNTFRTGLGSAAHYAEFITLENVPLVTLANLLPDTANVWWHRSWESRTSKHWGRDSVIQLSFRETFRILAQLFGPDIRTWQWGKLHSLVFQHPFHQGGKTIARLVDVPAGPMPGGPTTVSQATYFLWNPYEMQVGPSMRMIATMNDDVLEAVLPTGNSEAIFSDHYKDMLPLYLRGSLLRLSLDATYQPGKNWKRFELSPQ
ncbi:MAG TPA: penicillin acylase family protein [Candidatus Kapabacteria bacterium]